MQESPWTETDATPLSGRRANHDAHDGFAFLSGDIKELIIHALDQYHDGGEFCVVLVQFCLITMDTSLAMI